MSLFDILCFILYLKMNTKNDVHKLAAVYREHYGDKTLVFHRGYCF